MLPPFVQLVEWLIQVRSTRPIQIYWILFWIDDLKLNVGHQEKHMVVWVEAAVLDDNGLLKDKKFQKIKDKLVTFKWVNGQTAALIRILLETLYFNCIFTIAEMAVMT